VNKHNGLHISTNVCIIDKIIWLFILKNGGFYHWYLFKVYIFFNLTYKNIDKLNTVPSCFQEGISQYFKLSVNTYMYILICSLDRMRTYPNGQRAKECSHCDLYCVGYITIYVRLLSVKT